MQSITRFFINWQTKKKKKRKKKNIEAFLTKLIHMNRLYWDSSNVLMDLSKAYDCLLHVLIIIKFEI